MNVRTSLVVGLTSLAFVSSAAVAQTVNTSGWLKSEMTDQWRATKLKGVDIYNENNEKLGDVNEIIIDRSGKVDAVVIGVGGFLGMGEHDVAVPMSEIKWVDQPRSMAGTNARPVSTTAGAPAAGTTANTATGAAMPATVPAGAPAAGTVTTAGGVRTADNMNRGYPDHGILNMTKDQLKAAPEFKYAR